MGARAGAINYFTWEEIGRIFVGRKKLVFLSIGRLKSQAKVFALAFLLRVINVAGFSIYCFGKKSPII